MTNIIVFPAKAPLDGAQNMASLLRGVAERRQPLDDVYWLKENAELLSVLTALEMQLPPAALAPFERFYDQMEERLRFYPQYYRFFLSICLDLEDLGLDGCKGQSLCRWVASTGLVEAELSDLQRAEATRLLARRGAADPLSEGDLEQRLNRFVARPQTFALPNKKAAYELTHIVFYLSEYGKKDPQLSEEALVSLEYTGLLAYLDQNHDLLAEVCLALRFAGMTPSAIWSQAVADAHVGIVPAGPQGRHMAMDGFHTYLVTGWAQRVAGQSAFEVEIGEGPLVFREQAVTGGALRPLSKCLYDLGRARRADWSAMRAAILPYLDADSRAILQRAEDSSAMFGSFFKGFSRAVGA